MGDDASTGSTTAQAWGTNVLVEFDDGIAWVTLNRPEKRNTMNPALNEEMVRTLDVEIAADYLTAKNDQLSLIDPDRGREKGMKQFLDDKSFKPGLEDYRQG